METRSAGEVRIVNMVEKFDGYVAKEIETELNGLITAGAKKIICDFSSTAYISSAGLRVLLSLAKKLQKIDGTIVLCSLKPYVTEVFDASGFTQLFQIFNTQDEALKAFI